MQHHHSPVHEHSPLVSDHHSSPPRVPVHLRSSRLPADFSSLSTPVPISVANLSLYFAIQLIPEASEPDERDCDHGDCPGESGLILQTARMPRWRPVFDVQTPDSTAEDEGLVRDSQRRSEEEKDDRHHDRDGRHEQDDLPFQVSLEPAPLLDPDNRSDLWAPAAAVERSPSLSTVILE